MTLKYCKSCVLPNTRPNISFNSEGFCAGCISSDSKKRIVDWNSRDMEFHGLINDIKNLKKDFDCLIPVSGGKDSTWQVVTALEYGLKPLCVTWKSPARNSLGERNLQNLISLGVNHIDYTIDPRTERIFTRKAFERYGTPLIPMHMGMHAITLQLAINFQIPLVMWGENSAFEYGGDDEMLKGSRLTTAWLKEYGVTNGTVAEDWIDDELSKSDLVSYAWPSDVQQERAGVSAIFLAYFKPWDPRETLRIASKAGFVSDDKPKTGFYAFADIDDAFLITIHHWMKWYKFGFSRLWDNLSLEIRNGRMSRETAIDIIAEVGEEKPHKEIDEFCSYVDITERQFYEFAEKFRDRSFWKKKKNGNWEIENFLLDNWNWA